MDIQKYIYSTCTHPVRIRVYDPVKHDYVMRDVPCGKCLHCRITKVNEWCTRLHAQALYSKYVYFITLDYAPFDENNEIAMSLAYDTYACKHSFCSTNKLGLHPLLLCPAHLTKFFKRLRNHGAKFQYFACGEYGTTYNRPHFHCIVFSDSVISNVTFQDSWTVNGYKIGNVDVNDLRANGTFLKHKDNSLYNPKNCFKYVCKYLQKGSWNFQESKTWSFIKKLFDSSLDSDEQYQNVLFRDKDEASEMYRKKMSDFLSSVGPYVVCSRNPSIGFEYFKANVERFKVRDFRLFGLSDECDVFPSYFLRKTKESLCRFQCFSKVTEKSSSSSRLGVLLSLLDSVVDSQLAVDNFKTDCEIYKSYEHKSFSIGNNSYDFKDLYLYDNVERILFKFEGTHYTLWQKIRRFGVCKVGELETSDVLRIVNNEYQPYYNDFLVPLACQRDLRVNDLDEYIVSTFSDDFEDVLSLHKAVLFSPYDKFKQFLSDTEKYMVQNSHSKQIIYNQSKVNF